jgi:phospholipid/cholesterol/gamma-HCH transport system substrate-binding protein
MRDTSVRDTLVGLFVLAGLGAVAYLSVSLGGLSYRGEGGFELVATFDEIGGLKPRSQVVIGGVRVGQVKRIDLDPELRARVTLDLAPDLELPADTSASILTAGVLGDQYVALEPGGEEDLLRAGDEVAYTQDAFVLERLIGRVVQNLGVDSESSK